MTIVNCYYCGSTEHTFYAQENGLSLVRCRQCGLLFLRDRPDDREISAAHKQGRHRGARELDNTGRFDEGRIPVYLDVLNDVFKGDLGDKRTWLDVGCGHGEFLLALQQYGSGKIAVRGTEPNERKQQSARKKGLNVSYFDLESHQERYDGISLLNVYSHLPDPPAFLRSLRKLLVPGGELLLETGDTAHLSARDHYRPFYLPDHLSFASQAIVAGILERVGFEILSVNKYSHLPRGAKGVIKEAIKALLPGYSSMIRYFLKWPLYSHTDMFIRARLR